MGKLFNHESIELPAYQNFMLGNRAPRGMDRIVLEIASNYLYDLII